MKEFDHRGTDEKGGHREKVSGIRQFDFHLCVLILPLLLCGRNKPDPASSSLSAS
jgi:hypothetical protein